MDICRRPRYEVLEPRLKDVIILAPCLRVPGIGLSAVED